MDTSPTTTHGTLLAVDGHSLAFRAFFALPVENFTTKEGQPTNAVYGFLTMLAQVIEAEHPDRIGIAFDVKGGTFRNELLGQYKGTREAAPQELLSQLPLIQQALEALGVRYVEQPGYEGDDVIATLATMGEQAGYKTLVLSGDRDAFQLIDDHITVLYPGYHFKDLKHMDPQAVLDKYHVTPQQYPDLAALRGETADNIPGVPGVGDGFAAKWINQFGGLEGIIQDTSDEDISATREGKVADCSNLGTVEGDRNVGGIAGAVAIEFDLDPEDDTTGRFSFGSSYETKAVLMNCVNRGAVTGKKDCVGGLAGRMDLGTALECQNYGPVASTGGNYVGGVAGYADASIRSCHVKSTLSGENYVGGIAGWASRLRDCRAIVTIEEGTEYLGAIAGGIETDGALSGNLFVDTGTAGVDGVSYAGRAEPIPFNALSQLPDIPPEFTAFTLTLVAEEKTVAQIPFLYGEDLSRLDLPPVPELEGNYGVWPEFDVSGLRSDLTVNAVYTPWVTVVASRELSGKLALALAEGQFTGDAVLHVTDSVQVPPQEAGEQAVVWDVVLAGAEPEDSVPLRLLSPDSGTHVWQYQNGQWQQVEAVQNGQYLLLTMTGTQGTFCIQSTRSALWLIPAVVGGLAALAALVLIAGKHKRKAAKAQKGKEEPASK